MPKVVLFTATTLDGFIARPDGNLDWLIEFPNPDNLDYGYSDFMLGVGSIIMGKNTYNEILSFGFDWPYKGIESYVAASDPKFEIKSPDTFLVNGSLANLVERLKQEKGKDIWLVGGGKLITSFLNHHLIDRMVLTIIPTIIGDGIRLFPDKPKETSWALTECTSFKTGIVNLIYDKI